MYILYVDWTISYWILYNKRNIYIYFIKIKPKKDSGQTTTFSIINHLICKMHKIINE